MDQYPLLGVAEEVVAGYRERLEAEGWTVKVKPNAVPGTVNVDLEHPLVPFVQGFSLRSPTQTAEGARRSLVRHFETYYQFALVRDAPVRPERQRLVGGLRGAARRQRRVSAAVCDAVTSVGYTLSEEGVLLRSEADWLAEALDRDLEEDQRPRR